MTYDALIIGGRAAGGSLAVLLAQRGYRVLVVDRDRFPSDTMSTHFMTAAVVPLLDHFGVLTELVDTLGFRRLTRTRIYLDDCIFEGPMDPAGYGYALAPRRDVLDSLLVRRAMEYGAEFSERTRAERLIWDEGRVVGAELRDADGERREVQARVVVGADGKYSSVAKWVDAETYEAVPAMRPIYYAHFHGIEPLPEPAVELFFGGDSIAFIFPMRPGEDCLALELQPEQFDAFRSDPIGALTRLFGTRYGMSARMRDAVPDGKVVGAKGVDNYFRKPYGPGWVLTGDAAYLKDPSTGTGIGDALQQSIWLAEALDECLTGADWESRLGAFQQQRDQAMMPIYRFTLGFTQMQDPSPESIELVRAVLSVAGPSRLLAYALPEVLRAALPPPIIARVEGIAQTFGAQRASSDKRAVPAD